MTLTRSASDRTDGRAATAAHRSESARRLARLSLDSEALDGSSCRPGRTGEIHKQCNGVCLSDYLACACHWLTPLVVNKIYVRPSNKMYVRWLDAIEDFRFDVTHPPGARNRCRDADSRAATAPRRRRATRTQRVSRSSSLASVATHPRRRCSPPSAWGGRTLDAPQRQPSPTSRTRRGTHTPPHRSGWGRY